MNVYKYSLVLLVIFVIKLDLFELQVIDDEQSQLRRAERQRLRLLRRQQRRHALSNSQLRNNVGSNSSSSGNSWSVELVADSDVNEYDRDAYSDVTGPSSSPAVDDIARRDDVTTAAGDDSPRRFDVIRKDRIR